MREADETFNQTHTRRFVNKIHIQDLRLSVRIGIYDHEKKDSQDVSIDLEIALPGAMALRSDNINDTIDYAEVVKAISELAGSRHFNLVEFLADRIATLLVEQFRASWVKVAVSKIGVIPGVSFVGVSIEREAEES